jgi:serine/threonine protein kinase
MSLSVENVCGLMIRSRLLAPEAVKSAYQRWLEEAKNGAGEVSRFAKWLVSRQYLTEYQAALLLRGHADSFFLGDYKLHDRLGRGRMAGVYKAVHSLGQVVAIKVLPPSKAKDQQVLARFLREARLAIRLKHPNVVRTFQVGQAGTVNYLVMEFLEGETLEEVLKRRGKLPPAEGVRLIHQALLGLDHIHGQGLVHRDLKPANLMLVPARLPGSPDTTLRSFVKILDIGLGRALFDESLMAEAGESNLTTEGAVMGTPDYLAPEQARNAHAVDIRADIYSLGCVLYHVLSGQPPFPDTNLINQIYRHATENPRPLRDLNPAVPDGLQQILDWMMAKDLSQRYPTPARAAQALQVFLAAGAEPAAADDSNPSMDSYLSWLEAQGEKPGDARPATPAPAPPATVAAVGLQAMPRAERPAVGKLVSVTSRRKAPTAQKAQTKPGSPLPAPPGPEVIAADKPAEPVFPLTEAETPGPAPELGVELVPADDVILSFQGQVLTRRDLLMLGIGAGTILFAGLVGGLAAWLNSRGPHVPDEASGADSNREND